MKLAIGILMAAGLLSAMTPGEAKIQSAKAAMAKPGATAEAYADLAWAYLKRARETTGDENYKLAQSAIDAGLKLMPGSFEVLRANCALYLARGENEKALALARTLRKQTPDDVLVHGLLSDALLAAGKVDEAEKETQWMLDLRPGNVPGMLRGAELRRLFGDAEGAIDWLSQAYRRVRPEETEERAYIMTRISEAYITKGDSAAAVRAAEQSLKLFPDYPLGKAQLERARRPAGVRGELQISSR